ncbi:MAG TPA: glycosyltransferase [Candidatus Eisenbergiella merdipullorum]|uniref:Glycosyltransferase n=1 Tax=Candidatus Eisenbergiella merdipullorum TaxID=2838553 RepID=A0A9D2I3V7_9FIRM|nr:glycosyltransferase [Candidatus Eisenbergiella merdipullorum]
MSNEARKEKIVLIGPVYPYKGGISHYTGMMYRALSKKYQTYMVSYSFQYPKLLYKKEQRDYTNDSFRVEDTKYWIHTANPVNWIHAASKIKKLQPDLVIIQWWHPYFAPCYWTLTRMLGKLKILFVCHNVFPHERFPMDRMLTKMVLKRGNAFIVQSGKDAKDLQTILPGAKYEQAVHPTYNAFKFENMSKKKARELLDITEKEKVLLFFGFVREYKGLKYLIQALPRITEKCEDVRLFVVGDFGSAENREVYEKLMEENQVKDFVTICDGYIPDREIEKYFAACDLVVLPYVSATQSGIVQIAYGFEKPVVVTNVGGLPDVVEDGKTGYVVEPENPVALADAVVRYFAENREEEFEENVKKEAYRFDWDRMVETVERLNQG